MSIGVREKYEKIRFLSMLVKIKNKIIENKT